MLDVSKRDVLINRLIKKNILVIDDDGLVTRTICELLKRHGYYVDSASDGYTAIDKTDEEDFDLIIADIRMPNIDGVETIKRIRELSAKRGKPKVPVVFITGYADAEINNEARKIGEIIFKPFDMNSFIDKISKYIE